MRATRIQKTTDALVIGESTLRENDKVLTLLTRDFGVIRAFASGAKSMKSKRFAACTLFSYAHFTLAESGDTYKVSEAVLEKSFFAAAEDIVVYSLARYLCDVIAYLVPEQAESESFLRLILNSFYYLVEEKREPQLIKAITELRIAVLAGFAPNLIACAGCSVYESPMMFLNASTGELYCSECRGEDSTVLIPVDPTMLSALRHIVYCPFEKLYRFTVPQEAAARLSRLTERYLSLQCEHHFSALNFYHSLF